LDGIVHATSSLVENFVHQRRLSEAATLANEGVQISVGSQDAEVRCRALHAACWLAGTAGDLDSSRRIAEELVSDARAAGLVEFEAKTLADLAWMHRASGEHEAALQCATLAVERALEAGTGGSVVSAFTELSLASIVNDDLTAGVRAVADALSFESGDDLSPSSILRLALAMVVLGERLEDGNLVRTGADLVATVRSVDVSAEVWPGDEQLVGAAYRAIAASAPRVGRVVSDVDAINHARAVGRWLDGDWPKCTAGVASC
jgi:hypothetical protein